MQSFENIFIDEKVLGGVTFFEVLEEDFGKNRAANIILHRYVLGNDEIINDIRSGLEFTFKIFDNPTFSGFIGKKARVKKFKMTLSTENNTFAIFKQEIYILTDSFYYTSNVSNEALKKFEKEDFENLKKILKTEQENAAKKNGSVALPLDSISIDAALNRISGKTSRGAISLTKANKDDVKIKINDEDLIFMNVKEQSKVENFAKSRKINKKKK